MASLLPMRVLLSLALLLPLLAQAQPGTHPVDRELARVGLSLGPGSSGGFSAFTPSVGYSVDCYRTSNAASPYYDCGSMAAAFLVDGELEYDLLSTHTLFLRPSSALDPYVTGYAGVGYGEEAGLVYGGEVGLNLWLTEGGGLTVYAGRVVGERQQYTRLGIGLVVDTASR